MVRSRSAFGSDLDGPPAPGGLAVRVGWGLGRAAGHAVRWARAPRRVLRGLVGPAEGNRRRRSADVASGGDAVDLARREGLDSLARTLDDPNPEVRRRALEVISEFSAQRAAPLLTALLHDVDAGVRCAAAAAAARVGARATVFSLILALDDPDPIVRDGVARALAQITGETVEMGADDDDATRRRQQVERLTRWWKSERVSELAAELDVELPE